MKELDDVLKHHGILGMKWGVRRDYRRPGGADGKPDAKDKIPTGFVGKRLNSLKRERQWSSVLRQMDNLSTKSITEISRRVSLENSLKTLSKSKVGTKKDREDYFRRQNMSNQELSRKVSRLTAKDGLYRAVRNASKEQRELGEKIVNVGQALSIKYVRSKINNKPIELEGVWEAISNSKSEAKKERSGLKEDLLKKALDEINKSRASKN